MYRTIIKPVTEKTDVKTKNGELLVDTEYGMISVNDDGIIRSQTKDIDSRTKSLKAQITSLNNDIDVIYEKLVSLANINIFTEGSSSLNAGGTYKEYLKKTFMILLDSIRKIVERYEKAFQGSDEPTFNDYDSDPDCLQVKEKIIMVYNTYYNLYEYFEELIMDGINPNMWIYDKLDHKKRQVDYRYQFLNKYSQHLVQLVYLLLGQSYSDHIVIKNHSLNKRDVSGFYEKTATQVANLCYLGEYTKLRKIIERLNDYLQDYFTKFAKKYGRTFSSKSSSNSKSFSPTKANAEKQGNASKKSVTQTVTRTLTNTTYKKVYSATYKKVSRSNNSDTGNEKYILTDSNQ